MKTFALHTKDQVYTVKYKADSIQEFLTDISALRLQFLVVKTGYNVQVAVNLNTVLYFRELDT